MLTLLQFLAAIPSAIPRFNAYALNPAQNNCVTHTASTPLMIVAGPGSGKTTVLVLRALRHVFVDGFLPEEILLTTFTRKASEEIRSRLLEWGIALRNYLLAHPPIPTPPNFSAWINGVDVNRFVTGTLDSICEDVLRHFRNPTDPVPVLVEGFVGNGVMVRQSLFPTNAHRNPDLQSYLSRFSRDGRSLRGFSEMIPICRTLFDRFSNDLVDVAGFSVTPPDIAEKTSLKAAYDAYVAHMHTASQMDFALLERTFLDRLTQGRLVRFTNGLKALLVDEFQDTNPLQEAIYFRLVDICAPSFTVVGDDDQSLYRFRGATVELFTNFAARLQVAVPQIPKAHRHDLVDNYRSTPEIVDFINGFVRCSNGFQTARVVPAKPPVRATLPPSGLPVLGMFRQTPADLADALTAFLMDVFRGRGRRICGKTVKGNPAGGDFGDAVLLSHSVNEYAAQFGPTPPRARLPLLMRERLHAHNIAVYNPRGRQLRDIPQVMQLLGLVLKCIDPHGTHQAAVSLRGSSQGHLQRWRDEATDFIHSNPSPRHPHTLSDFMKAWGHRTVQGGGQWPREWPLLELCFTLVTWLPFLQNDPEGQVYLEAIARGVSQAATFSPYKAMILSGSGTQQYDDGSVQKAIQDIFAPLAESEVDVDEEIMNHVPRDRLPFMTIHQAKGLEFPLVIVDVSSDYQRNHAANSFRRFPRGPSSVQIMENELAQFTQVGATRISRSGVERAFDDLIRLYYVAYSRPQMVLMLVGTEKSVEYGTTIQHIATGWEPGGQWTWRTPARPTPRLANAMPLHCI
jgi:DNA helicase-2/ATP-dependent DNA helicase PcrA